jgi:hypothetical protein
VRVAMVMTLPTVAMQSNSFADGALTHETTGAARCWTDALAAQAAGTDSGGQVGRAAVNASSRAAEQRDSAGTLVDRNGSTVVIQVYLLQQVQF